MSCEAIIDVVTRETGRFGAEIYNRYFPRRPWYSLVKKLEFPQGLGSTISNLTYEASRPTTASTWTTVTPTDGQEGGSCLPPAVVIPIGSTVRNFTLAQIAREGPDFCLLDTMSAFEIGQQLDKVANILGEYIMDEWQQRYRSEYIRLAGLKVSVDGTLSEATGSTFPASAPTSTLTQGVLDRYYLKLWRNGATAMGMANGAAVLAAIMSSETSDQLIKENADIRQDYRYAEPGALLKPLNVQRSYRNFFHIIDPFPPRYSYSGGVFTEIQPFTSSAATKGTKAEINSSWTNALYEGTVVFDPDVFHARIPRPRNNPHPQFPFDPTTYVGDIKVMNIKDRECNPDGNIIYHRALLAEASEPIHPERGVVFVHKRCDPSVDYITACS